VLGDFNSRSHRDSAFKRQGKGLEGYEMTDAFEAGGFVDTTCKHGKNALYSFGSPVLIPRWAKTMKDVQAKRRRIDYIFADKALSRYFVSGTILHSDDLDMMSDHYPVQTIFRLPSQIHSDKGH
jgi:exodeoxyribonuclease III